VVARQEKQWTSYLGSADAPQVSEPHGGKAARGARGSVSAMKLLRTVQAVTELGLEHAVPARLWGRATDRYLWIPARDHNALFPSRE
jgi:hypothetical protein